MARTANLSATITVGDKTISLPTVVGSEREVGLDIAKLRAETGAITLDPGFGNTGACESAITFIDGDAGILRYRGIPIEQLAEKSSFVEVAYLLMFGALPTQTQIDQFRANLGESSEVDPSITKHYDAFPADANPMAVLSSMLNTLACFHPGWMDLDTEAKYADAATGLVSKIRTLAAYGYRRSIGKPYVSTDGSTEYVGDFLRLMFSTPGEKYAVDADIQSALNMILILHADHEQNCSTSTVRVVGSSGANLFASVASGVCALWGPLHGGANVAVLEMLGEIHKGGLSPDKCIELAKDKKSSFRLMGFGHRVYKNFDPRAKILKAAADKILSKMKVKDPLLDIAQKLEELALKDSYFVERKLYPNVDFYSGILMKAMGIPVNMFTVMFAIGRLPGWIAHWQEQNQQGQRIARPRQIYTGPNQTDYVPIEKR
jgi:citrate synthase